MNRRGQMFILTVVFLVGMIFALQQVFLQYSFFDLPETARKSPLYLSSALGAALNKTVQQARTCGEVQANTKELAATVQREILQGFSVEIVPVITCAAFDAGVGPALAATVQLIEKDAAVRKTVSVVKEKKI